MPSAIPAGHKSLIINTVCKYGHPSWPQVIVKWQSHNNECAIPASHKSLINDRDTIPWKIAFDD